MKTLLTCFIVSLLVHATVGGGEEKTASKINGSWTMIGSMLKGKKEPPEAVEKSRIVLVFKDGKYTETVMGKVDEAGTYKIDATKNPANIDFTITEGEQKGKVQLGLIKIDGDVLTLATGKYGSTDRPKNFDGTADDNGVSIYKRNK